MSTPLRKLQRSPPALARATRTFTPTVIAELQGIERDLGGRAAVVGLLVLAPLTKDLQYLLGLLGDPHHAGLSLAEVCATANVLPGELLKHLAQASLMRGRVLASQRIGGGIAAVAEDIMRRAAPYEDACNGGCRGTGTITPDPTPDQPNPSPQTCETCLGTGKLVYRPDLDRQKLAVELAQLLPKGGGVQIAVQQHNHPAGGGTSMGLGTLERLQAVADALVYGEELTGRRPPVAEGELAEADTDEGAGEAEPDV